MYSKLIRPLSAFGALLLLHAEVAYPQTTQQLAPTSTPAAAPAAQAAPVFSQEELDQILAPIALYPDSLLAQILMAATYPLEIVQADRWVRSPENAKLKGDQLAAALDQQTWDPSVKSLVPFPQVLQMMSDRLDWTQKLGDAVLAQQQDVMASVQRLRALAQNAGTLKSTEQQTVATEGQSIIIQLANPQVVYVPAYNPTVIYGGWPYPAYPPYYYPPPPAYYPYASAFASGLAFAAGVAVVGSMWGWGNFNWGRNNININYNTYNTINRTNINAGRATQLPAGSNNWRHDARHRGGVAYRDPATRQAYQRPATTPASTRQNFRGYDGGTRPSQGLGGAGQGTTRPSQGALSGRQGTNRPQQGAIGAGQGANRPQQGAQIANRPAQGATRPAAGATPGQTRPSTGATTRQAGQAQAFNGMGNGKAVSAQADRGRASRQAASASRTAAPRAAAAGGAGGARRR